MKLLVAILIFIVLIRKCKTEDISMRLNCTTNTECSYPNGQCLLNRCVCSRGWIIRDKTGCTYKQRSKLTAFLLSFFVGSFGVDWFYLSRGRAAYIVAGIIKLLTGGGFGIWWIIDWARILANHFFDGNGIPLLQWNN